MSHETKKWSDLTGVQKVLQVLQFILYVVLFVLLFWLIWLVFFKESPNDREKREMYAAMHNYDLKGEPTISQGEAVKYADQLYDDMYWKFTFASDYTYEDMIATVGHLGLPDLRLVFKMFGYRSFPQWAKLGEGSLGRWFSHTMSPGDFDKCEQWWKENAQI